MEKELDKLFNEGVVSISLKRFRELEQLETDKTIIIYRAWGYTQTVYTSDEAVKKLAKEINQGFEREEELQKKINTLNEIISSYEARENRENTYSWSRIFSLIKDKFRK